jgi:hypothetical protein
MDHLARERLTMSKMVGMYCSSHHATDGELCEDCSIFLHYAEVRLDKCPYGQEKPTCSNCPVHCYKSQYRAKARQIMRYSGPRMLLRHPILAIAHKLDGLRKAVHPRALTRERRLASRKR